MVSARADGRGRFVHGHRENTADAKREVIKRLEPKITELKQENEQLWAQLNELKAKVEMITSLAEMERALDARQAGRDAAKRGEKGERGERGERGQPGLTGPRGPAGRPATFDHPPITAFKIDVTRWRIVSYLANGMPGPTADLKPLFQRFLTEYSEF